MRSIYTSIPETNYVPGEYSVAAILLLLFIVLISLVPVLNLLYFNISTFRSMCAVTNMAVLRSSLTYYYYYYYYHHHRRRRRRRRRLLSQAFSSRYFSRTNADPHRSRFKLHTAVLSVLCVMFQV